VLAHIAGGGAHALMIGQQGIGTLPGQCLQLLRVRGEKIQRDVYFALHGFGRQVATGCAFEQAAGVVVAEPLRSVAALHDQDGLENAVDDRDKEG